MSYLLSMKKKKTKKDLNKILKRAFWVLFSAPIVIIAIMLTLAGVGAFGPLPTFEELESPKSNVASDLIADDGSLIGQYYVHNRSFVEYSDLSPNLVNALVSTEDARFTSHSGIDFIGLFRVAFKSVLLGSNQGGGSTISQQLAKNLFPREMNREDSKIVRTLKTITFKMKEWITAIRLEYNYTKEEILVMYFNVVEYGSNAYGIKSAAQTFFGKLPSEVTVEEAAMLVGVVNAPTLYSPVGNPEFALARRNTVIRRMYSNDKLTRQERDSISAIPINLNYRPSSYNEGIGTYFRSMIQQYMNANEPKRSNFLTKWDYEQEMVLWETDPLYGWCKKNMKPDGTPYNIYRDGLRIYTTLNPKMQKYAEEAVNEHMKNSIQPSFDSDVRRRKGNMFSGISVEEQERIIWNSIKTSDRYMRLPDELKSRNKALEEFKKPVKMKIFSYQHHFGRDTVMTPYDSIRYHKAILRASFVAMEPSTGEVKAYVGGNDFRFFKYDMVKQGKRQVGSTIKPFIYTFAIDHLGYNPCTPVPNLPVTVDGWTPDESGERNQNGEIRPLWWGLARSRNNFSAWIIKQSNYTAVADLIHKLGVRSFIDAVPSMCLGPSDITLYEMTAAYCTFVNMGVHTRPSFVTRIEDKKGNVISTFTSQSNEAISETSAATIVSILQKVVDGGTGGRIRWQFDIRGEIGGKTGTTNDGSDGWFIGIAPKLVAGGWVGGENPSIHPQRDSEGSRLALPIFGLFMKKVYADPSLNINMTDKFRRPVGYQAPDCPEVLDKKNVDYKEENEFFQ